MSSYGESREENRARPQSQSRGAARKGPKPFTDEKSLYEYAVGALGRRMRTAAELKRLLRRRVVDAETGTPMIAAVIERLKANRYLSDERYAAEPFAMGVSDDAKSFASSLTAPYCGVNSGFEAVTWLEDTAMAMSVALIPLRPGALNGAGPAFGMLVLSSPDPQRFQTGLATDFLERIAELASAALSRLRPR